MLTGTEVKALRAGRASLVGAFARVRHGEVWLEALHIPPYEAGNIHNHDPLRTRKLLMHRREIRRLLGTNLVKNISGLPANTWVSTIEASHFDPAVAYATFDCTR